MTSANQALSAWRLHCDRIAVRTTTVWARLPIYPIAIALAPVVSMYGSQPGSLERGDLGAAIGAAAAVATTLVLVGAAAYRDGSKAAQVHGANLLMRRLIDGVLERSPSPPVIIVQGDEGPYPDGTEHPTYEWRRATPDILRTRSGILNAYHLPGEHSTQLARSISPVNSFRVVFNTYLGTRLPLLPDRTISHGSNWRPFTFSDITHLVKAPQPGAVATSGSRRAPDGRQYGRRARGV